MTVIVDFNSIVFIILLVSNIMLCIVKVPMFGFAFGFLTIAITGFIFMSSSLIDVYFSYFLIVIAFMSIIINGLDFKRKK
jgi:hypothetical protein